MENQKPDAMLHNPYDNFIKGNCTAESVFMQQQRLQNLGLMVGEVAHDLNNVFSMILGHAELLEEDLRQANMAVSNRLESMLTALNSGADLCRAMLAYVGKTGVSSAHVDPIGIMEEMQRLFRVMVSSSVSFACNVTPPVPLVKADPGQIRQILSNLLMNASEALEGKNGCIDLHIKAMDLETDTNTSMGNLPPGKYVSITVADNGCGMTPETKANICSPFFTTKLTGSGLGMSSVSHIVQALHGALLIDTELGVGTTITVLLPATAEPHSDAANNIDVRQITLSGTILLVDDEEQLCKIGHQILHKTGATVITACSGKDALEYFRAHNKQIDLVLLDVMMPDINGCEVCKTMYEINPDANIVLISGSGESDLANQFEGRAPTDILIKPVCAKRLRQTAAQFLATREDLNS